MLQTLGNRHEFVVQGLQFVNHFRERLIKSINICGKRLDTKENHLNMAKIIEIERIVVLFYEIHSIDSE